MRESTLFGTMFGLGVAAVAIGVTVSRLVVGPALDGGAEAPAAALETPPPAVPSAAQAPALDRGAEAPAAALETPPPAVPSAARPPEIAAAAAATSPRPRRALLPRVARPAANVPASDDQPVAAAPSGPAEGDGAPIAVVRSRQALPPAPGSGRRPNGARIIRIDPD